MLNTTPWRFRGGFEHGVDDKGRVVIPQEFRTALGEEFAVVRAPDRAINLLPLPVWEQIEQTLEASIEDSILDEETLFLQRMFSDVSIARLDPQNRLAIPKLLREWAGISQDQPAILLGQGQKIEVWSKRNWEAFNERFTSERVNQAYRQRKAAREADAGPTENGR